jgi:hypothetical protein
LGKTAKENVPVFSRHEKNDCFFLVPPKIFIWTGIHINII